MTKRILLLLLSILLSTSNVIDCQLIQSAYIQDLKKDPRGPYAGIKWFCEDGTMREARDPCPEPMKGVQHAIYKENVLKLAKDHHLFLDQILTGTLLPVFWDRQNQQSRLKQYQITKFLFDADGGWILEKAQNYRGAKQIEDEKAWGQEFLEWVVSDDERLINNYLLIKLAAIDIPHGEDTRLAQRIRANTKTLADLELSFMNIRIKIHNNPGAADLDLVKKWQRNHPDLKQNSKEYVEAILGDMEQLYNPLEVEDLENYISLLNNNQLIDRLSKFKKQITDAPAGLRAREICELLKFLREHLINEKKPSARVAILDLVNYLESKVFQDIDDISQNSLHEIREKVCFMKEGMYGAGYIEAWEYEKISQDLDWMQSSFVNLEELDYYKFSVQKLVQWSTFMIQALYAEPVKLFGDFEPLVLGFTDDKIRSSLILPLGKVVEQVNIIFNAKAKNSSEIMGQKNIPGMIGLNPGIAKAKIHVLATLDENVDLDKNVIYAFDRPPADLKPVAGILNVKEGNPVSHVQLLARNLAIPNALIPSNIHNELKKYDGQEVFYAVSPKGTVVLKDVADLSPEENKLFSNSNRQKEKITISTDKIILDPDSLLIMSEIGSEVSGKWCGPKAANLGQLKRMFPEHVVNGIVIPFGVFKNHMLQKIPEENYTYWEFLTDIFENQERELKSGKDILEVEKATLSNLSKLQGMIEDMPLKSSFVENLSSYFKNVFQKEIGQVPVFLRSDTNMEDLPQFTGAGLNLTLFNVLDRQKILDGIKKVWASPYSERSYQWRQQYLNNPEEVYPSILIIPSVNVDRSGVIITKGVSRGGQNDLSISFSRGVGGAVEGQSAESYVIYQNKYAELINPGRETKYRTIPSSGGSSFEFASLSEPILSNSHLYTLREMSERIKVKMDEVTGENHAYDIELGIKDDFIWLFQVRPFVENKGALGSEYLLSLDPSFNNLIINLEK